MDCKPTLAKRSDCSRSRVRCPGAPGDHPWYDRDRGLCVVDGVVQPFAGVSWLQPFPLALGALTLVRCAYLAALYLALATPGNVREDFRGRGLGIGTVAGVVSVFTLVLLIADAPRACDK